MITDGHFRILINTFNCLLKKYNDLKNKVDLYKNHNNLENLQGGNITKKEFYHLNEEELKVVQNLVLNGNTGNVNNIEKSIPILSIEEAEQVLKGEKTIDGSFYYIDASKGGKRVRESDGSESVYFENIRDDANQDIKIESGLYEFKQINSNTNPSSIVNEEILTFTDIYKKYSIGVQVSNNNRVYGSVQPSNINIGKYVTQLFLGNDLSGNGNPNLHIQYNDNSTEDFSLLGFDYDNINSYPSINNTFAAKIIGIIDSFISNDVESGLFIDTLFKNTIFTQKITEIIEQKFNEKGL